MKIKSRKLQYKPLSNVAQFKKDAIKIPGGHREIYKDGKLIDHTGLEALSREQFDDINPREYFCDILCEDWYGDNLLDYIESNFNVSDYYSEGQSYILPDGEFLNLYDGAHIGVDDTLYEEGLIGEDPYVSGRLVLMDDYNSIRVSDGKYIQTDPYIELPKNYPVMHN